MIPWCTNQPRNCQQYDMSKVTEKDLYQTPKLCRGVPEHCCNYTDLANGLIVSRKRQWTPER